VGAISKLAPRYKQVDAPRKNRHLQILKSSSTMPQHKTGGNKKHSKSSFTKNQMISYQLHNTLQSYVHEQKTISSEDLKDILCIPNSEKTEFLQFANEDLVLLNCQQLAPLQYNW
jgi:hypothetical protein